jgi:hypothetical protein
MHQVSMQLGIKSKTCGSNQNKKLYSWHNFQLIVSEKITEVRNRYASSLST